MRVCCICAHDDKRCFLERGPWGKQDQIEVHGLPGEMAQFDVAFKLVVFKNVLRMSSASVGRCWGKVEKGPGSTQSLLCCPELFISDPQQSKAPTCFQTQHLDSSLVSKGYYSSLGIWGISPAASPTAESPSTHAVPTSR